MLDPINYFLVILGGFGVVWGYRHFTRQQEKKISEFEYAAFSAIWGIPVFILYMTPFVLTGNAQSYLEDMFALPMLTTPLLLVIGVFLGFVAAKIKGRHDLTTPNENRDVARSSDHSPESSSSSDQS